jgi:hypothetical protein
MSQNVPLVSLVPLAALSSPAQRLRDAGERQVAGLFLDDLPTTPNVTRLRGLGEISPASTAVVVTFGGTEIRREVRLAHLRTRAGRALSYFVCPECHGLARFLRLYEKPMCRRCLLRCKLTYRIRGSPAERAEARAKRIERLQKQLAGGPARLKPSPPGRTLDRRKSLEMSLRRAKIVAQQSLMRVER